MQLGFPVRVETKITETSGQNDLRLCAGGEASVPFSADYIWQWDKTREGLGPLCAIKFVENCQRCNMNDEITGKSHFRVHKV